MKDNDNAAIRYSFVSELYLDGVDISKGKILNNLPKDFRTLHQNGNIHIHDLEGYGKVYNCCSPDLSKWLRHKVSSTASSCGKILQLFEAIKLLIVSLAACQTGGIAFSNFDTDLAKQLCFYLVDCNYENSLFLQECVESFIIWINTTYTRYCREPYYVTINIGLDTSEWGRTISFAVLNSFMASDKSYIRPNIVFKVNKHINGKYSKNSDLFQIALQCTAKRMIPTYLLTDSAPNQKCDPNKLAVMGCRTRVYDNKNGNTGAIGRGNVASVSINLPRISLECSSIDTFYSLLSSTIEQTKELLLDRANNLIYHGEDYLHFVIDNKLWNASCVSDIVSQGTLSIGFIGLSECVEILTGYKPYQNEHSEFLALQIVQYIRNKADVYRSETGLNFSVLASPGEMISGRFCSIDSKIYPHHTQHKGFYTNSFHVNVDAGISIYHKIEIEAPYHTLCNGGAITYIEFESAPLGNTLSLEDSIEYAIEHGISYLGFNFPYDLCKECGASGTFDTCTDCGSTNIKRIRRVSGYLEELTHFTSGKIAETRKRTVNHHG